MARIPPWTIIVDEARKEYEKIKEIISADPDEAIPKIVVLRDRLNRLAPKLSDRAGPMYGHAGKILESVSKSLLDLEVMATGGFHWLYPLNKD